MENVISIVVSVLSIVAFILFAVNEASQSLKKKVKQLSYEKRKFIVYAILAFANAIQGATNVYYGEPYKIDAILMWIFGWGLVNSYFKICKILKVKAN